MTRRAAFLNFCAAPIAAAQIIITPGSTTFGPPADGGVYYKATLPWTTENAASYDRSCVEEWAAQKVFEYLIQFPGGDPEYLRAASYRLAPYYVRRIVL